MWRFFVSPHPGTEHLVDLPAAPTLKDGDGLLLEDGRIIKVNAALEALLDVRPSAADIGRIAWHLGNRHLPVQFVGDRIRLRADHVIEDMLKKLGAEVRHIEDPFDPKGGAYGHGHTHSHDQWRGHLMDSDRWCQDRRYSPKS